MKFGKIDDPGTVDLSLPPDTGETQSILKENRREADMPSIYIGCPTWNKKNLAGFYPKGTKDELSFYATRFNCIEFNASYYRQFPPEQFATWRSKVPEYFRFFTKITQEISQFKRLKNTDQQVADYIDAASQLEENWGGTFLQMNENFTPKSFENLRIFIENWPNGLPLAVELRYHAWYDDPAVYNELTDLYRGNDITHILTDTPGRRDLMHMDLTNGKAFIRWVGGNHPTDHDRIQDWVQRIQAWSDLGIREVAFMIHQHHELELPMLATDLVKGLNAGLGLDLPQPVKGAGDLFS